MGLIEVRRRAAGYGRTRSLFAVLTLPALAACGSGEIDKPVDEASGSDVAPISQAPAEPVAPEPAPKDDAAPAQQPFTDPPLPPELEEDASGLLPLPPRPNLQS